MATISDAQSIDLPLQTRADVRLQPETLDAEGRTIEMVWSTGAPVYAATGRRAHPATDLEGQTGPVVASLKPVLRHQLLVKVPDSEIPVPSIEQLQHFHDRVHRHPARRHLAQAAVV